MDSNHEDSLSEEQTLEALASSSESESDEDDDFFAGLTTEQIVCYSQILIL